MENESAFKKTGDFIRTSATVKIFSIGILIIILLIPIAMVSSLMHERQSRRDSVVGEIYEKWGFSQNITGPFFTVPYKSFYKDKNDKAQFNIQYFHILPKNLNISGQIDPTIRYRSIYEAVLYNAKLKFSGNFIVPNGAELNISPENILWDQAVFSVGITDMRGIQDSIVIKYKDKDYNVSPGLKTTDIASSGVTSIIPLSVADNNNTFSFELDVNGSEQIHFIPVGESTFVNIKSNWASPSFNGAFLPTKREITNKGFTADWKILHLNRNFPQFWEGNRYSVEQSSFGLKFIITADVYQKSIRVFKYAVMFVIFTFAAFFFSEIINKHRVHPIQYILVGLAVILFYVLVLSVSEHISFNYAYLLSAAAITLLITAYSKAIIKNKAFTLTVFGILAVLYSYLFIVLQLEDYALVTGSIGLLIMLSIVMYISRKIDWYSLNKEKDADKN
jgi:inner membrane protein